MWLKTDDGYADHPKIARLSDRAYRVHHEAQLYSVRLLTDGFIPKAIALKVGATPKMIRDFVDGRLWHEVEGGWEIHDFLEWNTSADEVKAKRQFEAARKAAQRAKGAGKAPRGEGGKFSTDGGQSVDNDTCPSGTMDGTNGKCPTGTTGGSPGGSPPLPDQTSPNSHHLGGATANQDPTQPGDDDELSMIADAAALFADRQFAAQPLGKVRDVEPWKRATATKWRADNGGKIHAVLGSVSSPAELLRAVEGRAKPREFPQPIVVELTAEEKAASAPVRDEIRAKIGRASA